MDPLMRQWLQGINPQKIELDWQNRGNKPLNETIYGIVARTVLREDINSDMAEFAKKYKDIHGIDPDQDTTIKAGKHLQQGGKLDDLFPEQSTPKSEVTPSKQPSIQRAQEIDISDFDPEKHIETPGVKFAKEYNAMLKRLDSMGVPRPPAGAEGKLRTTWNLHGSERVFNMMMDMAANESLKRSEEMGTSTPEKPKNKTAPITPSAAPKSTDTKGVDLGSASSEEITSPDFLKNKTPAQDSVSPSGASPTQKAASAFHFGTNLGFGILGAASLPKSVTTVDQSYTDLRKTGTYGLSRLGSGIKFDKTSGQYVQMTPDELKSRSNALMMMDHGKLVADASMATSGLAGSAPIVASKTVDAAALAASRVPQISLTPEDVTKIKNIPGLKALGTGLRTTAEVANKVFPPAAATFKAGEAMLHANNNEYDKAAKSAVEGSFWAAATPLKWNPLARTNIPELGIGRELFSSGVGNLYKRTKEGNWDAGAVLDATNVALGTMLQQPQRAAPVLKPVAQAALETTTKAAAKSAAETAAKEAGEIATKSLLKGAVKQIPVAGLAVSLPFAAIRAWNKDWLGAGLELAGAIPFGIGLGAQGVLAARDINKAMEEAEQNNTQQAQRLRKNWSQQNTQVQQQAYDPENPDKEVQNESIFYSIMKTGLERRGL